ncbi:MULTISPECIES: sporulation protein YqfC [Anaerotignum]|jgi:sporulation protein YqfC|uniref:Sporulation protein YqfC n=1 Tax=Anaerotignum propionicum DSM 1682 TaxID=991789 RepID=A0A120MK21_ANAPI|nr:MULTISPECIES: sporulation protein YqfC [Anaerotignum]HBF65628.1 sporulation protein YqfC [Clostridium sp.]AMJ39896.1 YabP family protein [Anaerotignum propionicum DSM 1682]MCQ4935677.1 sporulation protein YqfC [Anaerotignum propionicum]MEA5056335.1 sporulation protein YqfC [Anaerotignum propionicum]SHE27503.1 sporulation protein YqfC [[Clostridium] propionicum DSM 1682] [Anaerotignum propionicum DSM 1682]
MDLRRGVSEALDLPKEIMLDLPLISLMGREEITIENHKGILTYGEESIRIGTKAGTLCIRGEDLGLKQLTTDVLVITGKVVALEFLT